MRNFLSCVMLPAASYVIGVDPVNTNGLVLVEISLATTRVKPTTKLLVVADCKRLP